MRKDSFFVWKTEEEEKEMRFEVSPKEKKIIIAIRIEMAHFTDYTRTQEGAPFLIYNPSRYQSLIINSNNVNYQVRRKSK